jgi:hypothetical protein
MGEVAQLRDVAERSVAPEQLDLRSRCRRLDAHAQLFRAAVLYVLGEVLRQLKRRRERLARPCGRRWWAVRITTAIVSSSA